MVHVLCNALQYVKFHENISYDFQLIERARPHGRNGCNQCSKGNSSKSRTPKVMIYAFCVSSHRGLNLYEVS